MSDGKTILIYLLGAALLLVGSAFFSLDNDPELAASFILTPTSTQAVIPPATVVPTATSSPATRVRIESGPLGCITTPWGGSEGYRADAPFTTTLNPPDLAGKRLIVSGTVYAEDCSTPLPGVLLEVWHTDAEGKFNTFNFRGRLLTDSEGRYEFTTIKPIPYTLGNEFISAHIKYKVSYRDAPTLGVHLFFEGDPFFLIIKCHLPNDV